MGEPVGSISWSVLARTKHMKRLTGLWELSSTSKASHHTTCQFKNSRTGWNIALTKKGIVQVNTPTQF